MKVVSKFGDQMVISFIIIPCVRAFSFTVWLIRKGVVAAG
jgi:hypothetical protein